MKIVQSIYMKDNKELTLLEVTQEPFNEYTEGSCSQILLENTEPLMFSTALIEIGKAIQKYYNLSKE